MSEQFKTDLERYNEFPGFLGVNFNFDFDLGHTI
jgi:hypothetical protein